MRIKILLLLLALFAVSCTVTKKLSAAEILSKTKIEFASVSLDSATISNNLFEKSNALVQGLLPNPQVVALVQDFARGILEKEIGTVYFTVNLNAQNLHTDTLWIKSFNATLKLDSLIDLPLTLKNSVKLAPGNNQIFVATKMPVDKRIFLLSKINSVNILGQMNVALKAEDESFAFNFNIKKEISDEEKVALMDKARSSVLDKIINDWVGAILPIKDLL